MIRLQAIRSTFVLLAVLVNIAPTLAGEVLGRQYVVLERGPSPIPDNLIHVIPCTSERETLSVPLDCASIKSKSELDLKVMKAGMTLLEAQGVSAGGRIDPYKAWNTYTGIDQEIVSMLVKQPGYTTTRTDYEGKFSFDCPTKKCLVYSSGAAGRTFSYWMTIGASGSRLDLAPSNGKTEDMPSDI